MNAIFQTNIRTHRAIVAVRIERNFATMSELYDALNERNFQRTVSISANERDALECKYLAEHAPDLLTW